MTDAFNAGNDFSSADSHNDTETNPDQQMAGNSVQAEEAEVLEVTETPEVPLAPNGFMLFGLEPELLRAVEDLGYQQPTSVQQQTIPLALEADADGRSTNDLMVSSQTGSGKTAAFLLPVLQTLLKQQAAAEAAEKAEFERARAEAEASGEAMPKKPKRKDPTNTRHFKPAAPGALVLCPTRELAQQVAHDAIELVKHCRGLRVANVIGGMPYQLQIARLQNANLVIATPGRLLDLQRSSQLRLDAVQFLVIDEADRMLDLGFADDLADINALTIDRRQTMMFSATLAPRIQQLALRVMRNQGASVRRIQVDNPQERHSNITQKLFWADNPQHKRKLLDHWLRDNTIDQAIVFASTQIECDSLAGDLQQAGFSAVALHGALSQGLRNRRLMALRQGQVQILVATDVAARGIDVPTVTHVFNFGLPMKAEDYTHRIGRTGRAGRDGLAVSFAEFRDRRRIFDIEALTRQPLKTDVIAGLEPQQRAPSAPRSGFGGRGGERDYSAPRGGRREGGGGGAPRGNSGWAGGGNSGGRFDADRRGGGRGEPSRDFGGGGGDRFQRDWQPAGARTGGSSEPWRDAAPAGDGQQRRGGGEFVDRRPPMDSRGAHDRPARPAAGTGKVFVPRDAAKKRTVRPTR
ncbi:MAG: DEAD/DEAH box helicase [Burkholderiaceae bacterium]